jgi:hypothetical protein
MQVIKKLENMDVNRINLIKILRFVFLYLNLFCECVKSYEQKELPDNKLKAWMGNSPQIDDILVMGIRID